jgi:hypothetical protein
MYIVGDIGGGRIGNLTKDQALAWVLGKDGRMNTRVKSNAFSLSGHCCSSTRYCPGRGSWMANHGAPPPYCSSSAV